MTTRRSLEWVSALGVGAVIVQAWLSALGYGIAYMEIWLLQEIPRDPRNLVSPKYVVVREATNIIAAVGVGAVLSTPLGYFTQERVWVIQVLYLFAVIASLGYWHWVVPSDTLSSMYIYSSYELYLVVITGFVGSFLARRLRARFFDQQRAAADTETAGRYPRG